MTEQAMAECKTHIENVKFYKKMWFHVALLLLAFCSVCVAIPAVFWGIWYAIVGSIPMVMGYSRFWLDTISWIFYGLILLFFFSAYIELEDEKICDGSAYYTPKFSDYWDHGPILVLIGLFLAFDFGVSCVLSFAIGLTAIVVAAGIVGFIYGCWKLLQFIRLYLACYFCKKMLPE
jgi:hypothetical protein